MGRCCGVPAGPFKGKTKVKVLHISKYDCKGGAAIAALNAVRTQREIGIDATMLVGRKLGDDQNVLGPGPIADLLAMARFAVERLPAKLAGLPKTDTRSIGLTGVRLRSVLRDLKPEIVVLHNIDGVLRLEDLPKIGVPVVWRMHDAWPLLGTQHYQDGAPAHSLGRLFAKLDLWTARRKRQALGRTSSLTLVPPSDWLARLSRTILPQAEVAVIPNGIDTHLFAPLRDREAARRDFGLSSDDFVILFGAATGKDDPRKGFDLLENSIGEARKLKGFQNAVLATFGGEEGRSDICGVPAIHFGRIADRKTLARIYAAADISVVPSREENLSLTVLESLSSGTPVVAFNIGGMPDMIQSGINGWLVSPYDTNALAATITNACRLGHDIFPVRAAAREIAIRRFDRSVEAKEMLNLFESLLRAARLDPGASPEREADGPLKE
jgi:glycosyltransferase involved in cell wall biosynthesis